MIFLRQLQKAFSINFAPTALTFASWLASLDCVTTNLGALFETGAEFPMYIPFDNDLRRLSMKFASAIEASANILHGETIHKHLETQSDYVNAYYNWNKIGTSWTRFLTGAINAKTK